MTDLNSVGLPDVTEGMLKDLQRQADKARRLELVGQRKLTNHVRSPPMPASVSFKAIKSETDADDFVKVRHALGSFEAAEGLFKHGAFGIERQPPTPLPGDKKRKSFPTVPPPSSKPREGGGSSLQKSDTRKQSDSTVRSGSDTRVKPEVKPDPGKRLSNETSSVHKHDQKPAQQSVNSNQKTSSSSSQKVPKPDSVKQTPVLHSSNKNPVVIKREPVLETFNQKYVVQSKGESSKTATKSAPSLTSKAPETSTESRPVLKEKEGYKNVNGRIKPRPQLHIPENVEEMLMEFDVPQPLTAIQTPFKEKEPKFPFQESNKADQAKTDLFLGAGAGSNVRGEDLGGKGPRGAPVMLSPVQSRVVEEIQEKDTSSSDDDSASESGTDDSNDDDEQAHDSVEPARTHQEPSGKKITGPDPPRVGPGSRGPMAPDKTQQGMDTYSGRSSSDSSSSDSGDSSDGESDRDSDNEGPVGHVQVTTPAQKSASPEYGTETTPSPSGKWKLDNFLQKGPQSLLNGKPPSVEAPPSDKSEDHFDGDRRGADNFISDENPPSIDQDTSFKHMSADEFSPPAPIDKLSVLSPIKSPVKIIHSRHSSAAEKLIVKNNEQAFNSTNKFDNVKTRERKSSQSIASPDVNISDNEKPRKVRARKARMKTVISPAYISDSDSEIDVVNTSRSPIKSPHKSLPQKSQSSSTNPRNSLCSSSNSVPITSPARRKGAKLDKHLKEQDRVKLKPVCNSGVPEKSTHCDNSKAASKPSRSIKDPSVEQILDSFPGAKPLSPIPNYPSIDISHHTNREKLAKAGLATSPVKPLPLNGNISWVKGKPSVLVRIELNLLDSYLCVERSSQGFLEPKHIRESEPSKQPFDGSAKSNLPNYMKKSQNKVLKDVHEKGSSAHSAYRTKNVSANSSVSTENVYSSEKLVSNKSVSKKKVVKDIEAIPDFDALPVREPTKHSESEESSDSESASSSSGSSSSTSSDSDNDSEVENESSKPLSPIHDYNTASNHSLHQSPPDVKKRKLDSSRNDDSKRRRTLPSSPFKQSTPVQNSEPVAISPVEERGGSRLPGSVKRERHNSGSSQHSTRSHASTHSLASTHSRASSRGNKRPKVAANPGTATVVAPSPATIKDLKPTLPSIDRSDRALNSQSVPVDTSQHNGVLRGPPVVRGGFSLLEHHKDDERLLSADEYHNRGRKFKYQAEDMDAGLVKNLIYLESVLCFIQSGCAMERNNIPADATKMYKDTQAFVAHQYHQFELAQRSPQNPDKPEHKLAVLCQRIQSLLFMRLYSLKKKETLKLKQILEEHHKKSSAPPAASQGKPSSAPSPHQTNWNRSTGTPSPMSPQPSPANSICSVGSVGSDQTPSKLCNGTSGGVPPGSIVVSQRIHSITQKYFSNANYLIQAHNYWEMADDKVTDDIREFFIELDHECGPLTLHSSIQHLVRYVRLAISHIHV
ncbi:AF4/FMR2 family member 4-like isoform X2 [Mya arenaria]|uniref:AF4/FMR2 family member 4-like isoform X2 n=1 Tax=Mya arenaria TaxID=6604 RepID=UPI0022E2E765|nr:AF4/FMR2 family member 4-like isoform X2 [Mya arenaria]